MPKKFHLVSFFFILFFFATVNRAVAYYCEVHREIFCTADCECQNDDDCSECGCTLMKRDQGWVWCVPKKVCHDSGFSCDGYVIRCNEGDVPEVCGGCFLPETEIAAFQGEKQIQDLNAGDQVFSLDPQTGSRVFSLVEKIHHLTRPFYYRITYEDGNELKVTGEHPLLTLKKGDDLLTPDFEKQTWVEEFFDFFLLKAGVDR